MTRDALRRQLRAARRAFTPEARRLASIAAAVALCEAPVYRHARRIAVYLAMDGELDPSPFVMRARSDAREIYLPVLPSQEGAMIFRLFSENALLAPNRFGIPEPLPEAGPERMAAELDLVVTPLVAFDLQGNRLGMGAGFYDRTFAFLKESTTYRPKLVGYAYEMQKVAALERAAWDVPLSGVATEQQFYAI